MKVLIPDTTMNYAMLSLLLYLTFMATLLSWIMAAHYTLEFCISPTIPEVVGLVISGVCASGLTGTTFVIAKETSKR